MLTRATIGDLVSDGIDLALRFGRPPHSAALATRLIETRIVTVASPAYLRTKPRPLANTGRLTLTDVDTMLAAYLAGGGVAHVMEFGVEGLLASGQLVDLVQDWSDEVSRSTRCIHPGGRNTAAGRFPDTPFNSLFHGDRAQQLL